MIHEMRIYHCAPGRLPALNARFENITLKFWEKYGIKPVGFWTTLIGSSNQSLTYLLEWESLAEREQKMECVPERPGMDCQACRDRGAGDHCRADRKQLPGADRLFAAALKSGIRTPPYGGVADSLAVSARLACGQPPQGIGIGRWR